MMRLLKLFRSQAAPAGFGRPVDLAAHAIFEDPYPIYAELRRQGAMLPVQSGGYLLVRHGDIAAALGNPGLGNAPSRFATLHPRNRDKHVAADLASNILPFLDKPAHVVPRQVVSRATLENLRRIELVLPEIAARSVAAQAGNRVDLISAIASPFALAVMTRFLGLDDADMTRLEGFARNFFQLFAPIRDGEALARVNRDLGAFRASLRALAEERTRCPRDDLISGLLHTEARGGPLPPQQAVDNAILVFADGVENVKAGIANVLISLEAEPEVRADIEAGRLSVDDAVAEALRLDSPAQIIPRIARADLELHGVAIPADTPVFLALASGDRDPEAFPEPDRFIPGRDRARQLTFGRGRHSCIGARLASLQIVAMIAALLGQGARIATPLGEIKYHHRFGHRWPVSVAVQL